MDIINFIFEYVIPAVIFMVFILFTYVGIHMSFEKDTKKNIPLIWERGGFFNKIKRQIFNKSDVVYRDGDNT
jgi:L-asparagine transporter-like permease